MADKIELGRVVCTKGIDQMLKADIDAYSFINSCLERFKAGDWGDMADEDKRMNDEAVRIGGRIFAAYIYPETKETIYIITERDRSATTILFQEEY